LAKKRKEKKRKEKKLGTYEAWGPEKITTVPSFFLSFSSFPPSSSSRLLLLLLSSI